MLMTKGDLDGAIAKFESAHRKGPHYADPLEMWGEALIARNRSDLALAKFEEANTYAPNWGRLHLKWGEALWWSGNKDSARKQFAIATTLDLTPADRVLLLRKWTIPHG
jgi:tetratricopeptide (TPR) repeat protein